MTLTVNIPDFVVTSMQLTERRVLEAIALHGCRRGELTRRQAGEMLGMNFWEAEAFLKQHDVDYGLTEEDLENEYQALKSLLSRS